MILNTAYLPVFILDWIIVEYSQAVMKRDTCTVNYDVIEPSDPYQLYSTINECDMMRTFHQYMRLSSPESDTWSEDTLTQPSSPSLLQSCITEMEKKGLGLFPHYQNFPVVSDNTKAPSSRKSIYESATNTDNMPESPPIPCGGQFTTIAEVHSIYLEEKPGIASRSTERGIFQRKKETANDLENSKTHAANIGTGIGNSQSVASQELAVFDKEQSTSSPEDFNGSQLQYEDALSIYKVYIL